VCTWAHSDMDSLHLPAGGAVLYMGESESFGVHSDASDMCTYVQSLAIDSRRPANTSEIVRNPPNIPKVSDLPDRSARSRREEPKRLGHIEHKLTCWHKYMAHRRSGSRQWKYISIDGNDAYVLQNAQIEALETQNQKTTFERVVEALDMVERIAGSDG